MVDAIVEVLVSNGCRDRANLFTLKVNQIYRYKFICKMINAIHYMKLKASNLHVKVYFDARYLLFLKSGCFKNRLLSKYCIVKRV